MYYVAYVIIMCFRYKYYSLTPHQAHNLNNYGRALMSVIPQAITPNPHTNLLNVYIQIANKMMYIYKKRVKHITQTQHKYEVRNVICNTTNIYYIVAW
jgi:hypothetical protein